MNIADIARDPTDIAESPGSENQNRTGIRENSLK